MIDFDDIKGLVLRNHDIDSCSEYLFDAYELNYRASIESLNQYADYKGSGLDDMAKIWFDKSNSHDDLVDTAREGLGEAIYYNGTELHEHLAKYVWMVSPDRFEEEVEEYKREQE